jgi:hypothetical protein
VQTRDGSVQECCLVLQWKPGAAGACQELKCSRGCIRLLKLSKFEGLFWVEAEDGVRQLGEQ